MAELKGISEDQIRRAGRWNQEQMIGCYLNSLPRKFMRSMAGHPPQMGCFEIPRANIAPPEILLSMIWPKLDTWKDRFGPQKDGQINDLAAAGLTSLLFYLREVILQDSVALRQIFPGHPVWNHPVFQHDAYIAFAKKIEACQEEEEKGEGSSQVSRIYQAIPLLADHLKALNSQNEQRARDLKALINNVVESQNTHSLQLQSLITNGLTFRLETPTPQQLLPPPSENISTQASISATPQPTSSTSSSGLAPQLVLDHEPNLEPPQYRMCRAVRTVEALWREWTVGLQGKPSIDMLDRKWGSQWRAGRQSELQWYSLRLEVIKEIRHLTQTQRISEEAAMWQVSLQQQQMRCSLDQLCKRLRAGRKGR
jgi:hypothetical protein